MAHTHIVGMAGVGKTTLLLQQLHSHISYSYKRLRKNEYLGCAFVDPHGEAVDTLLEHLPKRRRRHVVVFDPTRSPNWNPIFNRLPVSVVEDLASANRYDISANLFFETGLYTFLVMQEKNKSIYDAYRFLTDKSKRTQLLKQIDDDFLTEHWKAFDKLTEREQRDTIRSFKTTLSILLSDKRVRQMLTSSKTFPPLEDNTIFLARLPARELGDRTVSMLGTLLISQLADSSLPLYVDQADRFAPLTLTNLLKRGDRSLTLAHQTLAELDPGLQTALLGSAETRHVFRVSSEDANRLAVVIDPDNTSRPLDALDLYTYRTFPRDPDDKDSVTERL